MAALWLHFLGDFILQSDAMASNKSKSNRWLLFHIAVYSACLVPLGVRYAAVNGATHLVVDWLSSRATSWLYHRQQRHWFFVVIGLDQAIHLSILFLTI